MKNKCWVHSHKHKIHGFFYHDQISRKYAGARLIIDGEECETEMKLDKISKSQTPKSKDELKGRYFAVSHPNAIIHLCTCRITKAQLDRARSKAKKFTKIWSTTSHFESYNIPEPREH